jgi:hypothetical protein
METWTRRMDGQRDLARRVPVHNLVRAIVDDNHDASRPQFGVFGAGLRDRVH